jgi:hypothetical protein
MVEPPVTMPEIADIVRGALAVNEASLVIYRQRTLIELKTDKLGRGLLLYEEDGYTSWQIGEFDDHHCHLDIGLCTGVLFGAEPVSCQAGRRNYTIWFLVDKDCGNPYRPLGYFSITFNKPYTAEGAPRRDLIEQMFSLYRRFEATPGVTATPAFLQAMAEGPVR